MLLKMSAQKRPLAWVVALVLVLLVTPAGFAQGEGSAALLPGAFGEAYDSLDEETQVLCRQYIDVAIDALLEKTREEAQNYDIDGYVEILHTTVFLIPGTPSPDLTDMQRKIYDQYYQDQACIVSFVILDNYMQMDGPLFGEVTGRNGSYAIGMDGEVSQLSLAQIRGRMYASPIMPGMRIINFGGSFNQIHVVKAQ